MATVTRENIGLLIDKITINVAKEDYMPSFEKALKTYGKQANIPGFRKGMVPPSLIKKMYGSSVLTDEVLRTVEKELTNYMTTEKLDIFAQPLPLPENDARQINVETPADYVFAFEVGLKPEFQIADLANARVHRYKVNVTDQMVNDEVERLRLRHGNMTEPETVTSEDNVLNLQFTETDAQGQPVEGGIVKDNSLLVKYFAAPVRNEWMGKKKGDSVVLQLSQAFEPREREWVTSDLGLKDDPNAGDKYFSGTITKLGLIEKAEFNEEFYKKAYPNNEINSEEDLKNTIRDEMERHWERQSANMLQHEVYHVLIDQTRIDFPETFLRRWLQHGGEQPKSPEQVEQEFPTFLNQLKWSLITDKIFRENNLQVSQDDVKEFAKQQLAGYMGMTALDESQTWISEYLTRMMQDKKFVEDTYHRLQNEKALEWAAQQVNAEDKEISAEEFHHIQHQHQH
jgi:trigger factor